MFCTKCGNQVNDDQKFCTKCGAPLGDQAAAPVNGGNAAPATSAAVTVGGVSFSPVQLMLVGAIALMILPIILWFCKAVTASYMGYSQSGTWAEIYSSGEDKSIMNIFRIGSVVLWALAAVLTVLPLVKKTYKTKRVRAIFPRVAAIIGLLAYLLLYFVLKIDSELSEYMTLTFGSWLYILDCIGLFVLCFVISAKTKKKKQ